VSPRTQGGRPGPLECAIRDTQPARARLERIYGRVPPVVYFVQREPDGPVKIGRAQRLAGTVAGFYAGGLTVLVRAVIPGGQPLEHWFHRRYAPRHRGAEWYGDSEAIVADARWFGDVHAFAHLGGSDDATVRALRMLDPFLADFERLYRNGATHAQLAAAASLTASQARDTVERMRALGFDLPARRSYGRRPVFRGAPPEGRPQ
jgi:hypothetical protein